MIKPTRNSPIRMSASRRAFNAVNITLLGLMAALCIAPVINIFSISLSSSVAATAGRVTFWPVDFSLVAYRMAFSNQYFFGALWISIQRVVLGTAITLFLNIITAYPLSRDTCYFKARKYYIWFYFFPMLFGGGLIPTFLVVKFTGLYDTIWALIVPGAVGIYNCILMLNFFRQLPKEMEEAAIIDGAGHGTILWKIIVPVSKPSIATVALFIIIAHWNEWFSAMIYMKGMSHYPLQTYLQSMLNLDLTQIQDFKQRMKASALSPKTLRAAMVFLTALPILAVYPFLQKYFTKGLVLGSVKG